ncbi:hypothetical protein RB195_014415 [Necator americanus]|uniref:Uncharacterized protein n=1 Tax=Necator americanus TaxID=51031 RepID=A0ABR1E079_NECAM
MESQFNRRNGARRRNFEINDAIFAKDYRGQKPTWTLSLITRRVENTPYTIRCGNGVWTRHVNHLRSRISTTATNTFLDVVDLPLLNSASRDDNTTPTADSFQQPQRFDDPAAGYRWTHEELDTRYFEREVL